MSAITTTRQRMAESSLLRAVIETVTDGLITIDARGIINSFNPAAEKILGYRHDEVIGKTIGLLMPELRRSAHDGYPARHWQPGAAEISAAGRETAARRKDGTTLPVELGVGEMRIGGKRMFVCTIRDITPCKAAEAQLEAYMLAVERSNQELDDFAYIASHDLEEPLRGLSNNATFLQEDYADDREAFRRALKKSDQSYSAVDAADGLRGIAALQRIHKIDAFLPVIMLTGQGSVAIAVQAMKEGAQNYLVKTALTPVLLHRAILSAIEHASLERKIAEQRREIYSHKLVLAETDRLKTAILASAGSMIIATDCDGKVLTFNPAAETALGCRAEDVICQHTPALWCDEAELATRAAELAIGRGAKIVCGFDVLTYIPRASGHETREWTFIRKDGSRFPVTLSMTPLRDGDEQVVGFLGIAEDITQRRAQELGEPGRKVLVCEDDHRVAWLIQKMLSREGFAADVVHSIPEARRQLRSGRYSAMTLDLTLPSGNGIDFARELQGDPATARLPIVVVSGTEPASGPELEGSCIVDWIVKPIDRQCLVASVGKAAAAYKTGAIQSPRRRRAACNSKRSEQWKIA